MYRSLNSCLFQQQKQQRQYARSDLGVILVFGPLGVIVILFSWIFLSIEFVYALLLSSASTDTHTERENKKSDGFSCCFLFLAIQLLSRAHIHAVTQTYNLHLILIEIFFALTKEMWILLFVFARFIVAVRCCCCRCCCFCCWPFFCPMKFAPFAAMTHSQQQQKQHLNKLLTLHAFLLFLKVS